MLLLYIYFIFYVLLDRRNKQILYINVLDINSTVRLVAIAVLSQAFFEKQQTFYLVNYNIVSNEYDKENNN